MYVCMYVSLHFPFAPQYFPQETHGFSSVFARRTSKNIEFFQIFGKRMQEAQASKKAGRGNRAWDPLFCDTGSPKTTLSGTSSNCRAVRGGPPSPPPKKAYVIDVGRGGVRGGGYPLSSLRYPIVLSYVADTPSNVGGLHAFSSSTVGLHPPPLHPKALSLCTDLP